MDTTDIKNRIKLILELFIIAGYFLLPLPTAINVLVYNSLCSFGNPSGNSVVFNPPAILLLEFCCYVAGLLFFPWVEIAKVLEFRFPGV